MATLLEDEDDIGVEEDKVSCCQKILACPGNFARFLCHSNEGVTYFCLLTPLLWCQLTTFLVGLWIISGLFWYLMFYLVTLWPTDALYAFLIAFALFAALFAVLMALDLGDDEDMAGMGCSEKDLKDHIGRQMAPGMSWEEFGYKWHIIQKLELHDDNPSEEVSERIRQVCQRLHYTNTIPILDSDFQKRKQGNVKRSEKKGAEAKTDVVIHGAIN